MDNAKRKFLAVDENVTAVFRKSDDDFAVFCANLCAKPRFGYGPVEPQVDATGRLVQLTFGPAVNDDFEE